MGPCRWRVALAVTLLLSSGANVYCRMLGIPTDVVDAIAQQNLVLPAGTEKIGKFDGKAFAKAMHGATIRAKDVPGVLLDVTFDNNGDLDRESFMTRVVNGKQEVIATLPPASAK